MQSTTTSARVGGRAGGWGYQGDMRARLWYLEPFLLPWYGQTCGRRRALSHPGYVLHQGMHAFSVHPIVWLQPDFQMSEDGREKKKRAIHPPSTSQPFCGETSSCPSGQESPACLCVCARARVCVCVSVCMCDNHDLVCLFGTILLFVWRISPARSSDLSVWLPRKEITVRRPSQWAREQQKRTFRCACAG